MYILHFTIFNSPRSFLLQNTIHTIDISFTNTFSSNAFQEKKEKKAFPIQLHSSHPFLTSFFKSIYTNNRRNYLKNRFNFHRKLTPSVIFHPFPPIPDARTNQADGKWRQNKEIRLKRHAAYTCL